MELQDEELKKLLTEVLSYRKNQYDQEQLLQKVMNSVDELKRMSEPRQKIYGASTMRTAFELSAENAMSNESLVVDWNNKIGGIIFIIIFHNHHQYFSLSLLN